MDEPFFTSSKIVAKGNGKNELQIYKAARGKTLKQSILNEDEYLRNLEKIVERDFFPDLQLLRAKNQLLEAQSRNDATRVRELLADYCLASESLRHHQMLSQTTPVITPLINPLFPGNSPAPSWKSYNTDTMHRNPEPQSLSDTNLDKFLAKNTSEDNASFAEILEEAENRRRHRMSWCYDKEEELLRLKRIHAVQTLSLPDSATVSGSLALESTSIPKALKNSVDNNKTSLASLSLAIPSSQTLKALSREDQTGDFKRSCENTGRVASWEGYRVHNSVFFVPEGVPLTAEEEAESIAKQRSIKHENTRFKVPFAPMLPSKVFGRHQKAQGIIRIGPDGKEIVPSASPSLSGREELSFVSACPSPAPGSRELGDESPLMTWGAIESTPFRLDPSSTPLTGASAFRLQQISDREKLAHELADKASQQHRAKKAAAVQHMKHKLMSPGSKFLSLSPAAQNLLSSSTSQSGRSTRLVDTSLRASYSPHVIASSISCDKKRKPNKITSSHDPSISDSVNMEENQDLTAGLINLISSNDSFPSKTKKNRLS